MPINNESLNRNLYDLLNVRGYNPVPKDAEGKTTPVPDEADVIKFSFIKNNENYGDVWATIDSSQKLVLYYDDEIADSGDENTSGTEFSDSWIGLLKHLKNWAQRRQLSFELKNKNHLVSDMAQRADMKKKENIAEGYYSMGKKASYSDAVPTTKIVLQHTRQIEEGEQRYRNIAKIFVENSEGERFAVPTVKPGIARVYARHIAEGGTPYDEKGKHITSLVEEYTKMAGFVRATRNGQFNESAQKLVVEGISHYQSLRETLHKMTGHRGYNTYFESWTPTLNEESEEDSALSDMFMEQMLDPRIESVMPILSRLKKNITEMSEVNELSEWADSIMGEASDSLSIPESEIDLDEHCVAEEVELEESPFTGIGKMMMKHKLKKGIKRDRDATDDAFDAMHDHDFADPLRFGAEDDFAKAHDAMRRKQRALDRLSRKKGVAEETDQEKLDRMSDGYSNWFNALQKKRDKRASNRKNTKDANAAKIDSWKKSQSEKEQGVAEEVELEESTFYRRKGSGDVVEHIPQADGSHKLVSTQDRHKPMVFSGKNAASDVQKHLNMFYQKIDTQKEEVELDEEDELDQRPQAWRPKNDPRVKKDGKPTKFELGMQDNLKQRIKMKQSQGGLTGPRGSLPEEVELEENLGPEQKRAGQLGPTEKITKKNPTRGKLVGASESKSMSLLDKLRLIEESQWERDTSGLDNYKDSGGENQNYMKESDFEFANESVDMGQADSSLYAKPKNEQPKMAWTSALRKAANKMGYDTYMSVPDSETEQLKSLAREILFGLDEAEIPQDQRGPKPSDVPAYMRKAAGKDFPADLEAEKERNISSPEWLKKANQGVAEGLSKQSRAKKEAESVKAVIARLERELNNPNPHLDKDDIRRRLETEKRRLELYRDVLDEQGVAEGSKKIPASNKPVDPKDLVLSLKDVPVRKLRGYKQYDPAKDFPGVKIFQKQGVAEGYYGEPEDEAECPQCGNIKALTAFSKGKPCEKCGYGSDMQNDGDEPFNDFDDNKADYAAADYAAYRTRGQMEESELEEGALGTPMMQVRIGKHLLVWYRQGEENHIFYNNWPVATVPNTGAKQAFSDIANKIRDKVEAHGSDAITEEMVKEGQEDLNRIKKLLGK